MIAAACQCLPWVDSLGRPEDRLLRPIAEARVRTLLLRVIEYGLSEKLLLAASKPELAAGMASAGDLRRRRGMDLHGRSVPTRARRLCHQEG